jgi:hypothetical protein
MLPTIRMFVLCMTAAVAVPAFAADNPWFGTWKLDPSKSHMTGDTFTYSKTASGMNHFSNGPISFDFTANGIDYPVMSNATTNWVANGPNQWKETDKTNGAVTGTSDIKLTADCKTMNITSTGTHPDGTAFHDEAVYVKTKSDGCLEGTWKSTKNAQSAPPGFVISQGSAPDAWKWEITGWKETVEGKADGSDLAISGPTVPAGLTICFTTDGTHKMLYQVKSSGTVISKGEQVLAANGKSYTDTSWTPGKENEKQIYVYNKQK